MKIGYMLMIMLILQCSIMLFDGTFDETTYDLNPYNASTNINNTENSVWNFVADPTGWSDTNFLLFLAGILSVTAFLALGINVFYKSDIVLLFGMFTFFLSLGAIPIISLYNLINRNPAMWGCVTTPCLPSILIWIFTGGLIALFYIMSVIGWWSGRPTT